MRRGVVTLLKPKTKLSPMEELLDNLLLDYDDDFIDDEDESIAMADDLDPENEIGVADGDEEEDEAPDMEMDEDEY